MVSPFLSSFLFLSFLLTEITSLRIDIDRGQSFCFSIYAAKYHQGLSLNYEIVEGKSPGFKVSIISPSNQMIYTNIGNYGRHNQKTKEEGNHQVCFDYTSYEGDYRIAVGFSIHADDPTEDVVSNADAVKIQHAQAVGAQVYQLNTYLDTVRDTQQYMKIKLLHRQEISRQTRNRVMWWSTVEAAALVAIAAWKIYSLKRTFEVKRLI